MKKCLFLIFTLLSLFFISDSVYAQNFNLVPPNTIFVAHDNGGVNVSPTAQEWWGHRVYAGGYYSYGGSTDSIPGGVAWVWNNVSICPNEDMLLKITLYTDGNENFFNVVGGTLWINGSQCITTANGGYYKSFQCSRVGLENTSLNISYNPENIVVGYTGVGIGYDTDLTCNPTTGTIIQNQIQNTQNIINNQNQNSQNIINNQNQNQQQTNENLGNINNSLNDDSGVPQNDVSNKANEWSSKLAGSGPVSNMVLMPITLLNGYINGFNSTCNSFNLGNLMGTDIILPCINISNYLGATLWNVIDILFSGFMIYAIGKKLVKIFNDFTNLRDNQMDDLYGGGK